MTTTDCLLPGAAELWKKMLKMPERFHHQSIGTHHFLYSLLENHEKMVESMAAGIEPKSYTQDLQKKLEKDNIGEEINPEELLAEILDFANASGKDKASERDVVTIVLRKSGWTLVETNDFSQSKRISSSQNKETQPKISEQDEKPYASFAARAKNKTPLLDSLGRDLCQEVFEGKSKMILGRDVEIQAIMETLCRWTKRNPMLIGPAGVGKTAIIEGLAQRIVAGDVPEPLKGIRLIVLQPSVLTAGAQMRGKLEERIEAVLKEASQDGIVLFIDEVHSIVGSGGIQQISDIGSQLKPALANGEVSIIGATTDAEYHRFIESDRALERRFQPLRVQELSTDSTLKILETLASKALSERNINFSPEALERIILFAKQYMRNRTFPDKAIDILEQTVAHATINEISQVSSEIVQKVAQQMIGMPVDFTYQLAEHLQAVKNHLITEAFCPEEIADGIIARLAVTARGLDINPSRPNIVLLSMGTAGQPAELPAQVLAQALFGDRNRLIDIDMTRFMHETDLHWLLGAPPGYIGHDRTPEFLLQIAQQPWSVILLRDINLSHPKAQEVFAQAIHAGYLTSYQDKKIYLSDAVFVLTIDIEQKEGKKLGFLPHEKASSVEEDKLFIPLNQYIIDEIINELDFSWTPEKLTLENISVWVEEWIFPPVYERYSQMGLEMEIKSDLVHWLASEIMRINNLNHGEQLLEEEVLPNLIPYLNTKGKISIDLTEDNLIQIINDQGGKHAV